MARAFLFIVLCVASSVTSKAHQSQPRAAKPSKKVRSLVNWEGDAASNPEEKLSLQDVVVTYVAGRPDYIPAINEYIMKRVPHGLISQPHSKTLHNFIMALYEAVDKYPDAKWYYICDDDSFVVLDRLVAAAARYNSAEPHYVGKHDGGHGLTGAGWACGGPGVLISQPLAKAMRESKCTELDPQTPLYAHYGDMLLAKCAHTSWQNSWNPARFTVDHNGGFRHNIRSTDAQYAHLPEQMIMAPDTISVHHITPEKFAALGKLYGKPVALPLSRSNGGTNDQPDAFPEGGMNDDPDKEELVDPDTGETKELVESRNQESEENNRMMRKETDEE
mmetsp:Transcript_104381/g.185615  ORF Transcript_104381/g.185615 Transcript_104381/m.185615 type:complete len:333 (+) Transcript_104381:74-1072(+)|eukprot:CAMPEP_0197662876 /NCGR_PEP_ID=MMETSP1338-20131121/55199_1 /TAXON_ID=43686 ORGANISM="Pelagodinium beii, Strain RCC1491" /NCGR_SAMPLE_ID=MMETSP1338 /ASSEMBLY_ACC=CAM_ASM_000754 /LENGTH=332 /DNA_ID=CAMNT_0043240951 /DNA_START=62 /DNA_END=1060 /DNA_ORIENTATION=-